MKCLLVAGFDPWIIYRGLVNFVEYPSRVATAARRYVTRDSAPFLNFP